MTAESQEAASALSDAERELYQWATGQRSFWNQTLDFEVPNAQGDVDRQLSMVRSAQRDAAEMEIARQRVLALRLLATPREAL